MWPSGTSIRHPVPPTFMADGTIALASPGVRASHSRLARATTRYVPIRRLRPPRPLCRSRRCPRVRQRRDQFVRHHQSQRFQVIHRRFQIRFVNARKRVRHNRDDGCAATRCCWGGAAFVQDFFDKQTRLADRKVRHGFYPLWSMAACPRQRPDWPATKLRHGLNLGDTSGPPWSARGQRPCDVGRAKLANIRCHRPGAQIAVRR